MLGLSPVRRRHSVPRNRRGPVATANLAERRHEHHTALIRAQPTLTQQLWKAVDYLKAVCKGREDRTRTAVRKIIDLAGQLDRDQEIDQEVPR
ncbi:hypothetical protein I0C86_40685 [Plantactinospora sp. S1510]|uniref:Uncharacterized protein n=1 Tax=Plantactinospora alkalitolerans TaxID=2789879 RepID=A0ABS0H9N5_9ACTN|nr:hypothetical protein [Plantactinospora alkalitolerans]MBF9135198.1 hypothetical protein [Plantactinospora alkalitolerans]